MVDLSIVQGLNPPQSGLANLLAGMAQGRSIRDNLNQGRDKQLLNQILAMENNQDQMDAARASGRAGTLIPAILERQNAQQKALLEQQKTRAEIGKIGAETGRQTAEGEKARFGMGSDRARLVTEAMAGLSAMGDQITPNAVLQQLLALTNYGVLTPEMAMSEYRGLPQDPVQLQRYIASKIPIGDQTQRRGQDMTQATALYGQDQQTLRNREDIDSRERIAAQQATIEREKLLQIAQKTNSELIESNGQYYLVNKQTGEASPVYGGDGQIMQSKGGADIPGNPQYQAREAARIDKVGSLLGEAEKLISASTGSYFGAAADQAARVFGASTDGAIAISQLKTIAGQLTSMMPRMEGPQSNYDVKLYQEMAGDLANPTLPAAQRMAALKQIKALQTKYAGSLGQQSLDGQTEITHENIGQITMADINMTAQEAGMRPEEVVRLVRQRGYEVK